MKIYNEEAYRPYNHFNVIICRGEREEKNEKAAAAIVKESREVE